MCEELIWGLDLALALVLGSSLRVDTGLSRVTRSWLHVEGITRDVVWCRWSRIWMRWVGSHRDCEERIDESSEVVK